MSTGTKRITIAEALPLVHVLVARLAETHGIRALAIKGPVLTAQGLRPPRQSVDVDVWVDPAAWQEMVTALEGVGWQDRYPSTLHHGLLPHSQTLANPQWPIELDVHERFPGFLGDRQGAFEAVYARHAHIELAGHRVPCTDLVGSTAVAALHYLRDPGQRAPDLERLTIEARARLSDLERRQLRELAQLTGSATSLEPLLRALDVHLADSDGVGSAADEWRLRTGSSGVRSISWVRTLRSAPLSNWPKVLMAGLFLTDSEIRIRYPNLAAGRWGLARGRVRRILVAFRTAPAAAWFLWRHDRRDRRDAAPDQ